MPRRDGTGPMNEGTLTGRGLGNCETAENSTQSTAGQAVVSTARGLGRGKNCMGGNKGSQKSAQSRGCGNKTGRRLGRNMNNQ